MTSLEHSRIRKANDTRMDRPHHWRTAGYTPAEYEALRTAERKARYGHRNWIYWVDRQGTLHTAVQNAASLKQALLDTGTQHLFTQIGANDAVKMIINWPIGLNMLRWARHESIYS
jgi:hypothetical protein